MSFDFTPQTLLHLDWPELCARLAFHCAGAEAQEFWQAPTFLEDPAQVEAALRLSGEALALLERALPPPLSGLYDLRHHLARVERGAGIEAAELLEVAATLGCVRRLRAFLLDHASEAPGLAERAQELVPQRELEQSIEEAFDESGNLADNASPELGNLRRRVISLHEGLTGRMEQLVHELDRNGHLQDTYFTLRQDRYVVPVRSGARGAVKGIVHDVSGSGQTLFVEPEELVEANNRLRIAQLEVREEEQRILAQLSGWVGEVLPELRASLAALNHLDRVFAGASLALELQASVPILTDGELELYQARHPLLLLRGGKVVANDLLLGKQGRVLVISGPNTGGKTVTLKMVGLFALMVRVGLPLPVASPSRFPLFTSVFSDIGDQQSIARSLSTFSAHLTNLASFLPRVDRAGLVLLDELVVGTDPREGEALASAILRWLAGRGAWTLVSTHYEALKALALEDPRFTNASVGFDSQTLAPTYRLFIGQPGRSSPLDIASRLQLPSEILDTARSLLPLENLRLEEMIRSLDQARFELEQEREATARARREAQEASQAAAREREAWIKRRQALVQEGKDEALASLREARSELAAAVRTLQRGADHDQIQVMRRRVQGIGERVEELARAAGEGPVEAPTSRPVGPGELRVGLAVLLRDKGLRGVVEAIDGDRQQATVRAGALRILVPVSGLRVEGRPGGGSAPGSPLRTPAPATPAPSERFEPRGGGPARPTGGGRHGSRRLVAPLPGEDEGGLVQTPGITCDLRGLRVDEAISELELFMDRSLHRRHPYIFVIHGHGTGALKQAVREYLDASPYVRRWRAGERGEGGDGVSAVWLDQV